MKDRKVHNTPEKFGDGWNTTQAFRLATEWIEQSDGSQFVFFCTNSMLSRGTVYKCKVVNGRAIAVAQQSWWAMSYTELKDMKEEDLGEVRPIQYNGMLFYSLGIFADGAQQPKLKVGRG